MENSHYHYVMSEDGKYYKIEYGKKTTYVEISEADFYKCSGYKKSDIEHLRKSVYPTQANDYLLLKSEGQLFPVDYKLVPLVNYLWKHNIKTLGWNQPDEYNAGFVSMEHYTKKKESALSFLVEKLKGLRYTVLDHQQDSLEHLDDNNKQIQTLNKKGIIVIQIVETYISININDNLLEKLYKHLGLKINEKKLHGNVIIDKDYFKYRKITKKRS